MTYLVMGAGGIGGAIGGYLAAAGRRTAFVARGAQLAALRQDGLTVKTQRKGELRVEKVNAFSPDDTPPKADVIFVCVKGYALDGAAPIIGKAAHKNSLIIPILNSLSAGATISETLKEGYALDGLIYTSSFVAAPGVIINPAPSFRIVCGPAIDRPVPAELLSAMASDIRECGIDLDIAGDIRSEMFKKFTFISAAAATDTMFDVPFGELQKPGKPREFFIALTNELSAVASAIKVAGSDSLAPAALKSLDGFAPDVTTSMHKDFTAGKLMETKELIFDVITLAESAGVDVPAYRQAAEHFSD